jgi:hypothetical protein
MRHLLALLDGGTFGTSAEPAAVPRRVPETRTTHQRLTIAGTLGTHGTPEIERDDAHESLVQRVADLSDAYAERIAILMEAGDISQAEARRIAEVEIGAAFVRIFLSDEVES